MTYYRLKDSIIYFDEGNMYVNIIHDEETRVYDILSFSKKIPITNERFIFNESLHRLGINDVIYISMIEYKKIIFSKQRDLKLNYLLNDI